jgi:NADPH2:quinone reductase
MSKAIRVHEVGGPEVLKWEAVEVGEPGPGQVRLRQTAVGLNFIDVYHRTGLYRQPTPFTPGVEAAGVVDAIGPGVDTLNVGDHVAYSGLPGAYAESRLAPAERLVKIPPGVSDETAAAMMLQGMTAQYLIRRTYKVKGGDTILIHAAAGGVGLILCQWAKQLGATVIGVVSTPEKAQLAQAHGCDHPIVSSQTDFVEAVKAITGGKGVPVVYDSVGRDTFLKSLDCLAPLGLMALFGQSSGAVEPIDPNILQRGSWYLTRPTLATYTATRTELEAAAGALFEVVASGAVKIEIRQRYPLRDAVRAHTDLEGRRTTGSTVLTV